MGICSSAQVDSKVLEKAIGKSKELKEIKDIYKDIKGDEKKINKGIKKDGKFTVRFGHAAVHFFFCSVLCAVFMQVLSSCRGGVVGEGRWGGNLVFCFVFVSVSVSVSVSWDLEHKGGFCLRFYFFSDEFVRCRATVIKLCCGGFSLTLSLSLSTTTVRWPRIQ